MFAPRSRNPSCARLFARAGISLAAAWAFVLACSGLAFAQAAPAQGAGGNFQMRLYINAYSRGTTGKTPQDPKGDSSGEPFGNDGAALEAIFYRHVGLSIAQDYLSRNYTDRSGNGIRERWIATYYSLTAYLKAAETGWNLFAGASTGTVDRYTAEVNGVSSPPTNPARNLPLTRYFGGIELAFSRIGFRAAYVQSEAADTVSGQKLELNQTVQVLSVFVPFN